MSGACGQRFDEAMKNVDKQLDKIRANPELMERIRLEEAYEMDYNTAIDYAEKTALESITEYLDEGQSTVGTKIDIAHIAATPVGMKVTCETELIEIDRRRLVFTVNVYDEIEKIAEGTHQRFIVDNAKFQSKVDDKISKIKE